MLGELNVEMFVLFVLVLLSAFFSLSETAITSVSRLKIRHFASQKLKGAKALFRLRENPSRLLSTVLIGNTIVNISASSLATSIVIFHMEKMGFGGISLAVGISTGLVTLLLLIFGEITPKTIAIKNADRLSLVTAPYIYILSIVLQPVIILLTIVSTPLIWIFGARIPASGPFISKEEIKLLLDVSEKDGGLRAEERRMISSIFEFGSTIAREVITPRPDIVAIEVNEPVEKLAQLMQDTGHSRIPVFEGSLDNMLGVVYAKELLKLVGACGPGVTLRDFLRPLLFIPETKKVNDLLHQMQAARTHIAVIVDEYGTTVGIITIEDLMEEIVGEIHDEFEKEEPAFHQLDKNIWEADARLTVSDANKQLGIDIPDGEYDTISGFVSSLLGKVPVVGDTVKYDDLSMSVERVHKRRIARVKIIKLAKERSEDSVGG
jgi:putative hemolysin